MYPFLAVVISVLLRNYSGVSCEEIAPPLRVAQCRASCVHIFSPALGLSDRCRKGSECSVCWDTCKMHQPNVSSICSQPSLCGPGCEAACQFGLEAYSGTQRAPVLVRRGEEVLRTDGPETRWPAPAPELEGPWVYLVMRRVNVPGSSWRQITQTLDLSARIPSGGMVRVLVVGKDGLVTIYGPAEETKRFKDKGWRLRQVSVIHQEAVVIAEVAWEAKHPRALYLVTWEVSGGGLRGNLLTSSTCVALSLWPDTQFHVQVELMTPRANSPLQRKSEELVIDTRRSKEMEVLIEPEGETEEDGGGQAEDDDAEGRGRGEDEEDGLLKKEVERDEIEKGSEVGEEEDINATAEDGSSSSYTVKKIYGYCITRAKIEKFTGTISALLLFLLLVCVYRLTRLDIKSSDLPTLSSCRQGYPNISLVIVPDVLKSCDSQNTTSYEAVT